jgi:hypothetical protein
MAHEPNKTKPNTPHRGRPRKTPESMKTRYLGFRLPEEEIRAIEAAAAAVGESVSEYVRKAIASRMQERKPLLPAASLSYVISSVRIDDNKLPMLEGASDIQTIVKTANIPISVALDEFSHKKE